MVNTAGMWTFRSGRMRGWCCTYASYNEQQAPPPPPPLLLLLLQSTYHHPLHRPCFTSIGLTTKTLSEPFPPPFPPLFLFSSSPLAHRSWRQVLFRRLASLPLFLWGSIVIPQALSGVFSITGADRATDLISSSFTGFFLEFSSKLFAMAAMGS